MTIPKIDLIRTASRQVVRELGFMGHHLAGTRLSPSAVHTIIEIGNGVVANARDLCGLLHLEKSTVSRLIKKLEGDGLIVATVDPSDTRVRTLTLTLQGRALLSEIETYARDQLTSALGGLSGAQLALISDGLVAYGQALRRNDAPSMQPSIDVDIREGYQPRLIARVVDMHVSYYSERYGFDSVFECKVASEMAAFMERIDRPLNTIFSAYRGDALLGSISIDGEDLGANTAHLRWFIVDPQTQGQGIGQLLISKAMAFVDAMDLMETHLWTFSGLDAARHLYEQAGFHLAEEQPGQQWGTRVMEQKFIRAKQS